MSLLGNLRSYFHKPTIAELTLHFELDRAPEEHRVGIFKEAAGQRTPVNHLNQLVQAGYSETHMIDGLPIVYTLSERDLQTLFSLRSMNPTANGEGWWQFPFAPPVLDYLRTKPNVAETEASSVLHVEKANPFKPTARVDFDSQEGMVVEVGYQQSEGGELVTLDKVVKTQDGGFAVVGDAFRPIHTPKQKKARELLAQGRRIISPSDIPEFFKRDLVLIKKEFGAVLTDLAGDIIVVPDRAKSRVQVQKTVEGWLNFDVTFVAGTVEIPLDLLPKTGGIQFVRINEATWVEVDAKQVEQVYKEAERLDAEVTASGYRLPVSQFASVEDFIEKIGGVAELNDAYRTFLEQLQGFQPNTAFALADDIEATLQQAQITLRPYQRSGIHWLNWLQGHYLHGILADDMGLGKTLQTIIQLRLAYEAKRETAHTLIIAPRSVLPHWERELARFFPAARAYRYHGADRRRMYLNANTPIIFISTYATVANDIELMRITPFFYVVLDEATYIKNPTSRRTQAIKSLNATHRIALSGTPVENRPAELWSLFDFLMRGHLGRYGTFSRIFENPITSGDMDAAQQLGERIRPFILRRLKQEVAKDLPEKIEIDEWCELSNEQKRLYIAVQDDMKAVYESLKKGEQPNYTISILPALTKLKQICDHPAIVTHIKDPVLGRSNKFDWVVEKVTEIRAAEEQVVIFSHFLDMLTLLEKACRQKGWAYIRLDGSVSQRQPLIDRFNAGQVPIALCSIKATGYGINLTAANHVIHADRWWNPAVEDQATDRVHRIGQDKTVYVYRILVENSLEERIDKLLSEKRNVASSIIGSAQAGGKQWSREELLEILKPID